MTYRSPSTLTILRKTLRTDSISKRGDVFTARKGFFYTSGKTAEDFAQSIESQVKQIFRNRKIAVIEDSGEVWKPFRGGATISQSSHWFVKFRVENNRELVESVNLQSGKKIMIEAWKKGGCCDPGCEVFWTM